MPIHQTQEEYVRLVESTQRKLAAKRVQEEREAATKTPGVQAPAQATPAPEPAKAFPMPSLEALKEMVVTVLAENPTLADTPKNGKIIEDFLFSHGFEVNLENMRKAILVMQYAGGQPHRDPFDRRKPPAPLAARPATPPEPVEVLEPGQLSVNASEWELRSATSAQLKDFIRRAKAAGKR